MAAVSDLENALKKLKDEGFRLTKIRKDLVGFILGRKDHWTIQNLAAQAQKSNPGVGIATIYRTVNLLQKQGLLVETSLGSSSSRYEVTPHEHHDHISCISCGKIVEFENNEIEKLQEKVAKKLGFKLLDHRMELFGLCNRSSCRKKGSKA